MTKFVMKLTALTFGFATALMTAMILSLALALLSGCSPVQFGPGMGIMNGKNVNPPGPTPPPGPVCIRQCSPPNPDPGMTDTGTAAYGHPSEVFDSCMAGSTSRQFPADTAETVPKGQTLRIQAVEKLAQIYHWEVYEKLGCPGGTTYTSWPNDCYTDAGGNMGTKVFDAVTATPDMPPTYRVMSGSDVASGCKMSIVKLTVTKNGRSSGRGWIFIGSWFQDTLTPN